MQQKPPKDSAELYEAASAYIQTSLGAGYQHLSSGYSGAPLGTSLFGYYDLADEGIALNRDLVEVPISLILQQTSYTDADLDAIYGALVTVLHEAIHATWNFDRTAVLLTQWHYHEEYFRLFEEGLTESFAKRAVDGFIQQKLLDRLVPGLAGRTLASAWEAYIDEVVYVDELTAER